MSRFEIGFSNICLGLNSFVLKFHQIYAWVLELYFDRFVICTLMVLLDLICISFLGLCSSCLCMFFMFVNGEKLILYFSLVFLFWEERDIKCVKKYLFTPLF